MLWKLFRYKIHSVYLFSNRIQLHRLTFWNRFDKEERIDLPADDEVEDNNIEEEDEAESNSEGTIKFKRRERVVLVVTHSD